MSDLIECRGCPSHDCRGCNNFILATALKNGKFDAFEENGTVQIEKIPAVDAVPVVRCRECINNINLEDHPRCDFTSEKLKGDDFCSRGKRREDGDTDA